MSALPMLVAVLMAALTRQVASSAHVTKALFWLIATTAPVSRCVDVVFFLSVVLS